MNEGMPSVILEAIKAHKLLEKILNKALILPAENVQEILKSPQGRKHDGVMVMQMVKTKYALFEKKKRIVKTLNYFLDYNFANQSLSLLE